MERLKVPIPHPNMYRYPVHRPEYYVTNSFDEMLNARNEIINIGQSRHFEHFQEIPPLESAVAQILEQPQRLLVRINNNSSSEYLPFPNLVRAEIILPNVRHYPENDHSNNEKETTLIDFLGNQLDVELRDSFLIYFVLGRKESEGEWKRFARFEVGGIYGDQLSYRGLKEQSWSSGVRIESVLYVNDPKKDRYILDYVDNKSIGDPKKLTLKDFLGQFVPRLQPSRA